MSIFTKRKAEQMKTYYITTQTPVNQCLVHSIMKPEYATPDEADARRAFNKEVETLRATYKASDDLPYSPTDRDFNNAVYCSLFAIDDEDPDEVEYIDDSEYFFE